jgi:hypothetical protein
MSIGESEYEENLIQNIITIPFNFKFTSIQNGCVDKIILSKETEVRVWCEDLLTNEEASNIETKFPFGRVVDNPFLQKR